MDSLESPQDAEPVGDGHLFVRVRFVVGLLISAGAIYAVVSAAGGLAGSFHALGTARPAFLVAGAVVEAASYACLGFLIRRLAGPGVGRITGVRLGLVIAGLGNILPASPAEGLTMAGNELRRRGIGSHRRLIVLGMTQWYATRALFGVAALDALVLALIASLRYPSHGSRPLVLAAVALVTIGVLALTAWLATRRQTVELIAVIGGRIQFWKTTAPVLDRRARGAAWHEEVSELLGSTRNQSVFVGLALASCLADAACFRFALIAVGVHVSVGLFLFAYGLGMISALVPLVPAGLGIVETVVPAILHHAGVPLSTALAGVVAYRVLGTLLPAVAGTIALVRLRSSLEDPPDHTSTDAPVRPALRRPHGPA
jgi:uncharacterized protein (TIRG00374 family)